MESYGRVKSPQRQDNPHQAASTQPSWKPPPEGWFKMNVDAAIKTKDQLIGLGIAIRNHKGEFITAAMKKSRYYGSIASAEAEVAHWGLEIAENAARIPLIIESNCQKLVNLITKKKSSKVEIFWTISEVHERLKRLNQFICQHTPRSCSSIAHTLAGLALKVVESVIWLETCPTHLMYLFS